MILSKYLKNIFDPVFGGATWQFLSSSTEKLKETCRLAVMFCHFLKGTNNIISVVYNMLLFEDFSFLSSRILCIIFAHDHQPDVTITLF